jgi:hypothetical protein
VQHEPAVPLAPPWSHCSPTPLTTPSPQKDWKLTCTKCPSLFCERDGLPG